MKRIFIAVLLCIVSRAFAADPLLKPSDTLAICGDSITEQKLYSVYIEDYLLMCKPVDGVKIMQFGWGGEQASGFLARMENDTLRFKPQVATTCYGMNDGHYTKLTDEIANNYRNNMDKVAEVFAMNNVRAVIGSPGCVDSTNFKHGNLSPDEYNKTLAAERDIAKDIAQKRHLPFADVYDPMVDVMAKAKAKYGQDYPVAGNAPDGIHPNPNGHVIMAYAFLKALGVGGDIGTITVDLANKKATATEGHTIKSFDNDTVTIESAKYPFCFLPDPSKPDDLSSPKSMRALIEFFPFNDDLNRFTLIVTGAGGNVKITWGDKSKEFSADQLSKGINLAAEFLDNPFVDQFGKVHQLVQAQQNFETPAFKDLIHSMPEYERLLPDKLTTFDDLFNAVKTQDQTLFRRRRQRRDAGDAYNQDRRNEIGTTDERR